MSQPGRILVVEDDDLLREALEEVLSDEGLDVRTASNGAEALDQLAHWEPDLIVLDLMMPVMDGFAFRAAQQQRGVATRTRVLVLSAARDLADAAVEVEADAYLPKPFRLVEVLGAVRRLLPARDSGNGTEPPDRGG